MNPFVRTGNQSLLALFHGLIERLIPVLCLIVSVLLWEHEFGPAEILLGVIVFALVPPTNLPYRRPPPGWVRQITASWALTVGLLMLLGLLTSTLKQFDQNVLATFIVLTPLVEIAMFLVLPHVLVRLVAMRGEHVAVIIGANELGRSMARSILGDAYSGTRVTGFFDDRDADRLGEVTEAPVLGRIERVADFVRANRVHQIFIALPMASQPRILKLLESLRDTTASIYFVPDIFMLDLIQARVDTMVGFPVLAVCETPFHGTTGAIKRMTDVIISLTAILLTAPFMLVIAAAIKLTMPGPVLFKQRRYGLDGEQIMVWKFRSMKVQEDGADVKQATKNDDRITPLGRFLRRTSLDELPQFFNVLQGKMSVVGPRPHAISHNETYRKLIRGYMVRHKVKPGITGLAQINGCRGETETIEKMEKRVRYDLDYLRHWSLQLDLTIIARTVLQVFKDPNAY